MALKGLDIFKLSPKKNCKECGSPTCMAFSMKVAQGAVSLDACPYFSEEAKAAMNEASAPPMKTIKVGNSDAGYELGGETVLYRHEKTFVNKTRYAVAVCSSMDDEILDEKLSALCGVDYERIGERMFAEMIFVSYDEKSGKDRYVQVVKKAAEIPGRVLILNVQDPETAKAALAEVGNRGPILNGADASNYETMHQIASEAGVALGVMGANQDELYDTVTALEKLGNRKLLINVCSGSVKEAFAAAVQFRRAAIRDNNRSCGYPSIVNIVKLAKGDAHMQAALLSVFTMKYGSIIVTEKLDHAQALPLFGLRQNLFTDPQKPMKVEPGIYPINGADENSLCLTTVDFALTYFVVSGEIERSGVPCNLIITDAGGMSVLTSWAAGKLSSGSISAFFEEQGIHEKIKCRKLVLPGKVAAMKKELEAKMPGWEIIVGPREAVQMVPFLKELQKQ